MATMQELVIRVVERVEVYGEQDFESVNEICVMLAVQGDPAAKQLLKLLEPMYYQTPERCFIALGILDLAVMEETYSVMFPKLKHSKYLKPLEALGLKHRGNVLGDRVRSLLWHWDHEQSELLDPRSRTSIFAKTFLHLDPLPDPDGEAASSGTDDPPDLSARRESWKGTKQLLMSAALPKATPKATGPAHQRPDSELAMDPVQYEYRKRASLTFNEFGGKEDYAVEKEDKYASVYAEMDRRSSNPDKMTPVEMREAVMAADPEKYTLKRLYSMPTGQLRQEVRSMSSMRNGNRQELLKDIDAPKPIVEGEEDRAAE